MLRRLSARLLRVMGWRVNVDVPDYQKSIICVAPHTSNMDFILCELAYTSVGRKAGFLMKESWFFFPLGALFRAIGGIPVPRGKRAGKSSLVETLTERFKSATRLTVAITPEGTRSRTDVWRTGFLRIAKDADVPVILAVLDYGHKHIFAEKVFTPSDDLEADMDAIKDYYSQFTAKYPEKFSTQHTRTAK